MSSSAAPVDASVSGHASHPLDASQVDGATSSPRDGIRALLTRLSPARWWPTSRWGRRLATSAAAFVALGAVVGSSWWWSCGFQGCPTPAELRVWQPTEGGTLFAHDGTVVSGLAVVRRINVPLTRVPRHVQASFIAVEDRRFRTHTGVDWRGVARATVANIMAGGVREGASTITMQLARNVFLGNRAAERSWGRKLLEWRYAGLIEAALSKDEILERYLNAIYLGNGVYGVEAASRDLFGKGVRDVTLSEGALLAGLPKAPSTYSPRNDRRKALARRTIVFDVLTRDRVATPSALRSARNAPLRLARSEWTPTRTADSWAVEAIRGTLDSLRAVGIIPRALNDAQLRVFSSIDRRAQVAAERVVAAGAANIDDEREWNGFSVRGANNRTQGAFVALDPTTGAVRAIVGGRRVERRGFHRALKARRQPGSTFKPFVYAAALRSGFTLATMVDDEPVEIANGNNTWRPDNYGSEYAGRITLRDALARSANAATVRVSRDVGMQRIATLAHAQGITSDLPVVPALALGAASVTPLELTTAYAPFANGGHSVTPYIVARVEDAFGRELWRRPEVASRQVIEATDAFLVTSLLQTVVESGTGRAVRDVGIRGPVAGKTGTTNDGTDVWFVGYTPTLVAGLWFGADTPQPLGYNPSGGRLAAPAWARFLRDGWHSPDRDTPWTPPAGIESRVIDVGTGKLAADWCGPTRREFFRTGTAPTESCQGDEMVAMRDVWPPDWHDDRAARSDRGERSGRRARGVEVSPEMLDDVMEGILDAARADSRVRAMTDRVLREIKRARDRRDNAQPPAPRAPEPPARPRARGESR